ncbi:MAG TPA: alpha/beta hydrolase [Marmoricola sp.]|nr:alpha/beta hydrolase [Marmoricola sp.]HNI70457.1 alpha/beta hydrolase [Marmoricola sp.]HNN47381.1 alpha/beta hydrolase [Marmoricola sp.]
MPVHFLRRVVAASILVLVGTLLVPGPAEALPTLTWGSCPATAGTSSGMQCALFEVPLDHGNPSGPKIKIALSRKLHTNPDYKGVIVTNPGGPGAPGRSLPAYLSTSVPHGVGSKYDWIGMDIRGVGGSIPSLHCDARYFNPRRPANVPRKPAVLRKWMQRASDYANACVHSSGSYLLPHLSTENIARDIESLRQALGVPRVSIYGFSFGSYLAQVYATLFPANVDRIVMDGVVDPTRIWYRSNLDQEVAFNKNINAFFKYLAAHPRAFKLGRRAGTIKKGYYRKLRQLTGKPRRHFGPAEFNDSLIDAGYYVYNWTSLGHAYSSFIRFNRPGGLLAAYQRGNMGDDNMYAVYLAVQCTDAPWPNREQVVADAWRLQRTSPFMAWSNTWYNAPCLSWSVPSRTPITVSGAALSKQILLISESNDAATPFSGALRVKQLFPTASLVEGVGGTTHSGSLSGVSCVDNTIANYLDSGVTPARTGAAADLRCPRIPPPRP